MRYVKHKDIDKEKWDSIIISCAAPQVYGLSWYLDITSSNWDAIIWGDYEACLPLPFKGFLFLKKIYQPLLTQQTGIFSKSHLELSSLIETFLKSNVLSRFISARIHFTNLPAITSNTSNTKWEFKKNYFLSLNSAYPQIVKAYNQNRKRNLKKALDQEWQCISSTSIKEATEMYRQNQARRQKGLSEFIYNTIETLFIKSFEKGTGELYKCVDKNNTALAFAFFIKFDKKIYYLFGTMNEKGREHSALSLIIDSVIKKYCNSNYVLDFEGGNIESIGNYFASFGASSEEYCCLIYRKFDYLLKKVSFFI